MKKVKEEHIAKLAGVSRATVSRVLNNANCVLPETAKHVIEAAHLLGFRGVRQRNIGVIIYRASEIFSYLAMALSELRKEIARRAWRMELFSVEDVELLNERSVSGVVNLSHAVNLNSSWAEKINLPLVNYYTGSNHADNIYCVFTDGFDVMKKTVSMLWKKGHRRIGYLSDATCEAELHRTSCYYDAFCREMNAKGELEPEKLCAFCGDVGIDSALRALFAAGVSALIVTNESFGPAAAQRIRKFGLRIPEDISIVTHESSEVSQYLTPPQTTILQDYPGMAKSALDLLEVLMRGKQPASDIALPCTLIPRESVAAPPAGKTGKLTASKK